MSGFERRPAALAPFMEPPYWMRVAFAMAGDTLAASHARIDACTSWACSGVAVLPVPAFGDTVATRPRLPHETRRLSCGRVDDVEATRHRNNAVDVAVRESRE